MPSHAESLNLERPSGVGLGASIVVAFVALAGLVAVAEHLTGLSGTYAARVLGAYGAAAVVIALYARRYLGGGRFGAANLVTLLRAALTAAVLGLLGEASASPLAWLAIGLAAAALVLDGVDGRLARRRRQSTAFGARFDMETDAVLILVLAALSWRFGKTGVWILAAGLMRYAFLAVGRVVPFLRRSLPPSRRRQTVCVIQVVALLLTIAPITAAPLSGGIAALGFGMLCMSFLVDVVWLWRRR